MADQPIRGGKPSAGAQNAKNLAHQRVLVGDMDDGILGEHHVKGGRREGQRAGGDLDHPDAVGEARGADKLAGAVQHGVLDINAQNEARAVVAHQSKVDAARAATDVENGLAGKVVRAHDARHLVRAAGGHETRTPDRFEHGDQSRGVMVFGHGGLR